MKKTILKGALAALLATGLTAGAAQAVLIDFTSSDFSGVEGQTSFQYNDYFGLNDMTLSTLDGTLTFNDPTPNDSTDSSPWNMYNGFFQFEGYGQGIGVLSNGDSDPYLNSEETLTLTFNPALNSVDGIFLTNFHTGETSLFSITYENGTTTGGTIDAILTNGAHLYGGVINNVLELSLTGGADSSFTLAGVNVNPVPEPGTMLLFGTGVVGLVGSRLRRKKK